MLIYMLLIWKDFTLNQDLEVKSSLTKQYLFKNQFDCEKWHYMEKKGLVNCENDLLQAAVDLTL